MTILREEDFKRIIARRDKRFDGRFFFGVKTTRIYCRPVCPVKPKPENILIFRSAAEAENGGYRACRRCRPELAPDSRFLDGTLNTVSRALRIISDSGVNDLKVDVLADSLGVSERHLRRLFDQYLGASPSEVLLTQRLHFAKRLAESTRLPFHEIAFMSGFQSLRRFNEAFKERFHCAPSRLRKGGAKAKDSAFHLKVTVRLPYDWFHVLAYLSRHECYGTEKIVKGNYLRFVPVGNRFGTISVSHVRNEESLKVSFQGIPLSNVKILLRSIENLFDTRHNPAHLPAPSIAKTNGIRVPGCFDPFEVAVSVILSQLVSTERAKLKLKALVKKFGRKIGSTEQGEVFEFPSPKILAEVDVASIGIARVKAQAIQSLAAAIRDKEINFQLPLDFSEIAEKLLAIKGIGKWTAEMIAMRCFGNPDAFPRADLIVKRALDKKLVRESDWSSSRAYLAHFLWRDYGKAFVSKKRKKV